MNVSEWNELTTHTWWSIYDEESFEREIDFGNVILDFNAPKEIPDGIYTIKYYAGKHNEGEGFGAIVENGKFVPEPTEAAIFEAVCRAYDKEPTEEADLGSIFIEYLNWDEENKVIVVTIGT